MFTPNGQYWYPLAKRKVDASQFSPGLYLLKSLQHHQISGQHMPGKICTLSQYSKVCETEIQNCRFGNILSGTNLDSYHVFGQMTSQILKTPECYPAFLKCFLKSLPNDIMTICQYDVICNDKVNINMTTYTKKRKKKFCMCRSHFTYDLDQSIHPRYYQAFQG